MNVVKEQWNRVLRLHFALQSFTEESDEYKDALIVLFQQLLTLRDWAAGEKGTHLNDKVYSFASSTEELRICKAIANGTKHLTWTPKNSSPELLSVRFGTAVWNSTGSMVADNEQDYVGTRRMLPPTGYWIVNRDNKYVYNAIALAELCIAQWRLFLNENRLI